VQQLLNDPQLSYCETLQQLWSGYGEVTRYNSPKLAASVIVKSVVPPRQVNHPQGWHSTIGHQRKLASYKVEVHFYQHYAQHCSKNCYVPQLIACSELAASDAQILVMEDLQHLGLGNKETVSLVEVKSVIYWLAYFHARFMDHSANDLWPIGTYWHLATRQDEYVNMQPGPLKQAANIIDSTLNNARYQTIVHGDAKLANFCFANTSHTNDHNQEKIKVAAVDFQYAGKGAGIKDLAYFLGSCLSEHDLIQRHDELVDYYFETLAQSCNEYQQTINVAALENEWRRLYSIANADFLRFLQGWSPQHHKINRYLQMQSDLALKMINDRT